MKAFESQYFDRKNELIKRQPFQTINNIKSVKGIVEAIGSYINVQTEKNQPSCGEKARRFIW